MSRLENILSGALLLVGLLILAALGVRHYGATQFQAGHAAAITERAAADAEAVATRTRDNAALASRQDETNASITKAKNEELAPVRERIVTQRVYVGSAVCGDRPSAPASPEGSAGSDSADSPRRLVREDVERDIGALKLQVEEDLATGRACQAFLLKNGLVP